jgi:MazG family protein
MSKAGRATTALLELMARLRDPERGCPWDIQQTFETIAPFTLEEAYEVADAIDRQDPQQIRDELGDLLFQIVFHSRMAEERGWFDFADVATSIHEKLVRRHPHVFAGAQVEDLSRTWEELKARERAAGAAGKKSADTSALADVPKALPALARAAKLGRRAARVGFDWQEPGQVRDKVMEELGEVDQAVAEQARAGRDGPGDVGASTAGPAGAGVQEPLTEAGGQVHLTEAGAQAHLTEELGDLMFVIANWALHLQVDPEEALRAANAKFESRFRRMEAQAANAGRPLQSLSPAEWDDLWRQAKKGMGKV